MRDFLYSLLFLIVVTAVVVRAFIVVNTKITERKRIDKILHAQNTAPKFSNCEVCYHVGSKILFKDGICPACGHKNG